MLGPHAYAYVQFSTSQTLFVFLSLAKNKDTKTARIIKIAAGISSLSRPRANIIDIL